MSTVIPFDIQEEIVKKVVPVKSLLCFRSVSKQWKSLIDSSKFITHHSVNQAHPHHLLVQQDGFRECKYVLVVDDDSFPRHKSSHTDSPLSSRSVLMVGCSSGLVCLLRLDAMNYKKLIVIWNPSIRKSVCITVPYGKYVFGFGVCPKTSDPKIVKLKRSSDIDEVTSVDYKAEVFTLSSRTWRSVSMNMPYASWHFADYSVVICGVIYWLASKKNGSGHVGIVSFDLTREEFGEVDLPNSLVGGGTVLQISKSGESLLVISYREGDAGKRSCDVWKALKVGDSRLSFTKDSVVEVKKDYGIIGFRKNGQPIMTQVSKPAGPMDTELKVYDRSSKCLNGVGIGINGSWFAMASAYTESLLLLNHRDDNTHVS